MSIFKKLFGGKQAAEAAQAPEQATADNTDTSSREALKQADTLKFDAIRAMRIGEFGFAIQALNKSLELAPRFETQYYLGMAYRRAGKPDEALAAFEAVLAEVPDHSLALTQRGQLLLARNDADGALADAMRVLTLTEEDEQKRDAYKLAAEAHGHNEAWTEAVAVIDQALQLPPEVELYSLLLLKARYLLRSQAYDQIEPVLQEVLKQNETEELVPLIRARIARDHNCADEARQLYHQVLDLDPFNVSAYTGLSDLISDRAEALTFIQGVFDEQPHNYYLGKLLVQLLQENGRTEEAEQLDREVNETCTPEDTPVNLGKSMYATGIY